MWEQKNEYVVEWIEREGKCQPEYLHLEDIKQKQLGINTMKDKFGTTVYRPDVLRVLKDFY